MWKSGNVSWLSLSNNSGNVEMSLGCLYVVTLEVWKCVLVVFICAQLVTLKVWKCGNMSSLSLSNNSGSVEIWKSGNVEMCLGCLYVVTLEVWKCGNMS